MRVLFWFLLLAGAAVAVALAARLTTGYALFVAPPYRVELSLNLLLVIVVASFVTGYVLLRIVRRALGLPEEVRRYRQRQQQERARTRQDAAVVALLEGRFGRARQFAEEALAVPQSSGLSALLGARAAIATREFAAAETLLARADAAVPSLAVPRLMLEAEMKLEQGQPLEALGILGTLRKEAGSHTAALRLELRALQAAGRYAEIPPLVDQLVKRKAYGPTEGEFVRAAAHAEELAARVLDGEGLRAYWSKLTDAEQRMPKIARAAARSFMALGGDRDAAANPGQEPRARMEFGPGRAVRAMPPGGRRAATRAGRTLARAASRRRDAPVRAGSAVRARATVGQGADLFRGEPCGGGHLAHARGAGGALCAAQPRLRCECAARRGAQARAGGIGAGVASTPGCTAYVKLSAKKSSGDSPRVATKLLRAASTIAGPPQA